MTTENKIFMWNNLKFSNETLFGAQHQRRHKKCSKTADSRFHSTSSESSYLCAALLGNFLKEKEELNFVLT